MAGIPIPRTVLDGILAVRDSGLTNMLAIPDVARIAADLGFPEAASWVDDPANKKTYAEGIFCGFEADDTPAD